MIPEKKLLLVIYPLSTGYLIRIVAIISYILHILCVPTYQLPLINI